MTNIIIAENLINDYCGQHDQFVKQNVHIGRQTMARLMGKHENYGRGPLPLFLENQLRQPNTFLLFFRDSYDPEDQVQQEHLERLGEHCIKGTPGEQFPEALQSIIERATVIDCAGLSFPLEAFREFMIRYAGVDPIESIAANARTQLNLLLVGFHTERRVYATANVLRNLFNFRNVAVFSHFLASFNKEQHFTSLRYHYPDSLIQVINNTTELTNFLGADLSALASFELQAVDIQPQSICDQLNQEQRKIVETICMHWTEARLHPLSGGFSGSALFIANGKQGHARTEPMVIKIDKHLPIRLEIRGYNLVKDLMGKHVPTFTFPVSRGPYSGVGMELAAMEGTPHTLQDSFEKTQDDFGLQNFLQLLVNVLSIHTNRIYQNTLQQKRLAPFRHFMLHITQQEKWLRENIRNILTYPAEEIMVMEDMVVNLFNVIRKNSDTILHSSCLAHGDLNFANIILDQKENMWTIDWTHSDLHPLEIDFAKMENDLKFVLCKTFQNEDLTKLKKMEELLLANIVPPAIEELSLDFQFIKWDLRFKKVFLAVRELRKAYHQIRQDQDWLVYKVALLRYGLHTLSFDSNRDAGECSPTQLWYALLSVESLLFELMGDDYHLKIRSERPADYPERFRIQLDQANWKAKCQEYAPSYFVSDAVLTQAAQGEADPEGQWSFSDFIDWGRPYTRADDNKPLNPSGRTGIAGRGGLWLWGANPMVFLTPIFYDVELNQLELLLSFHKDDPELICTHLRRDEPLEEAVRRAKSKIGLPSSSYQAYEVHTGYLYDPRQTDNAWVEAKSYLLFVDKEAFQKTRTGETFWKELDHRLVNNLYSSQGYVLRKAVQYIHDQDLVTTEVIRKLLEKTG